MIKRDAKINYDIKGDIHKQSRVKKNEKRDMHKGK